MQATIDARPGRGNVEMRRDPAQPCVNTIGVESLDATVASLLAKWGGAMALPKMPVPGVGWLAYLKDPDGNMFGMMQNNPNAR